MKNKFLSILSLSMAGLLVAGCGGTESSVPSSKESSIESSSQESSKESSKESSESKAESSSEASSKSETESSKESSPTSSSSSSSKKDSTTSKTITIFAGGSSEFSWIKGDDEEAVFDYVLDKYYNDTGKKLNFIVNYLGQDMKDKLASSVAGGSQVDVVISHTRGGDGIDDYMLKQDWYYDLSDAIESYAPRLYNKIEGTPLDSLTLSEGAVIGIPSVISPYKFGILVRKDLMEKHGYTDNPELDGTPCIATGSNWELVDNLDTFEEMCTAMKDDLKGNRPLDETYCISGAPWDWEKVLVTGAYSDAGYFTDSFSTKQVVNGCYVKEYADILEREYHWSKDLKITSVESKLVENCENDFFGGKTGVFVCDPTIQHLIKVARKTKEYIPSAEFTVLGALSAHKGDTKKGFLKNTPATFAASIYKGSKNVKDIMNFMNWVMTPNKQGIYENYEICRYGIPGTHWIRNEDGKTYSFPQGKEEYATKAPYSGILTLVENQNASNLLYKGYSEAELSWIEEAAKPSNYIQDNDLINYTFKLSEASDSAISAQSGVIYPLANSAWAGSTFNKTTYLDKMAGCAAKLATAFTEKTGQYNIMKQNRED